MRLVKLGTSPSEIKVKVLEVKSKDQKIKFGVKQLEEDPFNVFKDKKVNDVMTVKVISTSSKGILVAREGNGLQISNYKTWHFSLLATSGSVSTTS